MAKSVTVDGIKFSSYGDGYYVACRRLGGYTTPRPYLHHYIWIKYNGAITEGYEVHHKDLNKHNNDPSNLELKLSSGHRSLHGKINNTTPHENALKSAAEWHGSEEGKAWHSEQSKEIWENSEYYECICEQCGETFMSRAFDKKRNKFCSNKCKAKYRRVNKLDHVEKKCVVCGSPFMGSKYSRTKTCGKACSSELIRRAGRG